MSWLLNRLRRAGERAAALPRARAGNVGMIFGLSLIPIVGLLGLGVDYGVAMTDKTKLDSAADAAAVAAVATAKAYIAANTGQSNVTAKALAAGITQAINVFNVNAGTVPFASFQLQTPQLTRSSQTLNSTIVYTATVNNTFGRLFRTPTTTLANTVSASTDLASYLDFYLMVDVSGSMGLPTSTSDMNRLAGMNVESTMTDSTQGCMFACHWPGANGWTKAVNAKPQIQLRSDSVNNAVCLLLQRAANQIVPNQYRVGIYPFINQLATLSPLSGNLGTASTAADCAKTWPMTLTKLLDTNTTQLSVNGDPSTGTGSGGTHFEVALPQMKSTISTFGDGSSISNPKPFVFLVTDGMQNGQHFSLWKNGKYTYPGNPSRFSGYANAGWDGSSPAQMDPANCTALKNAGATISILYIPYIIINSPNDGTYTAWENSQVNQFSPTLSTPLKSCASPGYFFTASSSDEINASLSAMFDRAVKMTRLTQ